MVRKDKRKVAARLLSDLLDGQLTNEAFIAAFPRDRDDLILQAIADLAWLCYSDVRKHTIRENHIPQEHRRLLERALVFLGTNLEYEWPKFRFVDWKHVLLRACGFGWVARRRFEVYRRSGDWDVWPFLRKRDYEQAMMDPSPRC